MLKVIHVNRQKIECKNSTKTILHNLTPTYQPAELSVKICCNKFNIIHIAINIDNLSQNPVLKYREILKMYHNSMLKEPP